MLSGNACIIYPGTETCKMKRSAAVKSTVCAVSGAGRRGRVYELAATTNRQRGMHLFDTSWDDVLPMTSVLAWCSAAGWAHNGLHYLPFDILTEPSLM